MKEEMRRSKKIFYTQRVEIVESYHERRDCADQNIPRLLQACGYLPFPIPNVIDDIAAYLEAGRPDGILLTGGNSLICYGGNAAERDRTDAHVLQWAIEKRIPVYGFCRGMQSILDFFGVKLRQVENHVALRHNVSGYPKCQQLSQSGGAAGVPGIDCDSRQRRPGDRSFAT